MAELAPTIIPHGDHILVRLDNPEEITAGGIIKPQIAQEKAQRGVVVALGKRLKPDGEVLPYDFQVGQRVLVNPYAGKQFQDNEWLYPSSDILAYYATVQMQKPGVVSAKS